MAAFQDDCLPGDCLRSAVEKLNGNKLDEAVVSLLDIRDRHPGSIWAGRASFILGTIVLEGKAAVRPGMDGAALFDEAVELPFIEDYVLFYRAEALRKKGDYPGAFQGYNTLIALYPDSILAEEARFRAAVVLKESGEILFAREAFRAFEALYPGSGLLPDALLEEASISLELDDAIEAAVAARRVLAEFPAHPAARQFEMAFAGGAVQFPGLTDGERFSRGVKLFSAGRYDEAAAEFEALSLGAGGEYYSKASIKKAVSEIRLKKYREAEKTLEAFLSSAPSRDDELEALYWLAMTALRQSKRALLLDVERRLSENHPGSAERARVLSLLARHYEDAGERALSLAYYRRITEEFGATSYAGEALWRTGWIYYTSGDYAGAYGVFSGSRAPGAGNAWGEQFLYWAGRSAEKLGRFEEASVAHRRLCSTYPEGFYCLMARERGGRGETLAAIRPVEASYNTEEVLYDGEGAENFKALDEGRGALSMERGYLAAKELLTLGLKKRATAELERLMTRNSGDKAALYEIAGLFYRAGDYHRALKVYSRFFYGSRGVGPSASTGVPLRELSYPMRLVDFVREIAPGGEVDPLLVAAVMREESAFNPETVSYAGALGLMQIMPATGRFIAERLGRAGFDPKELFEPRTSIELGSWYLAHLKRRFNDDLVLTIAGYNAGPHVAARWAEALPHEADEFIESIPYPETRAYTKKVISSYSAFMKGAGIDGGLVLRPRQGP